MRGNDCGVNVPTKISTRQFHPDARSHEWTLTAIGIGSG